MSRYFFYIILSVSFVFFATSPTWAQVDKRQGDEERQSAISQILEALSEDFEEEITNDTYLEQLYDLLDHPLDLNKVNLEDLSILPILTDQQIDDFLRYREYAGKLIAIYELQNIPSFDTETIKLILPFVKVKGELDDFNVPLKQLAFQGKHEVFFRYRRFLEEKAGYVPSIEEENGGLRSSYLGNPDHLYFRYRHAYGQKISYGFTGEKDPGEEFFNGSQKRGFDFYSAHLYLRDVGPFRHIAVGDYELKFGQGLVAWTGLGFGKNPFVMDIKKQAYPIKQYTSVNEARFFRGIAATLGFGKMELTAFASRKKQDANVNILNITEEEQELAGDLIGDFNVTSFQLSGNHRTITELEDRKSLTQSNAGGHLAFKSRRLDLGITAMYSKLDRELNRSPQVYNIFQFSGDNLFNASFNYRYMWQNFHFFGETAASDNGGIASLNGVLIGLDPRVFVSVLHRYYERDYQSLFALGFGETTNTSNEQGTFVGMSAKPFKKWTLNAYFDIYKHPWLRSKSDAPSHGSEYLAQLTYKHSRNLSMYWRYRYEAKEQNAVSNESPIDFLVDVKRRLTRYDLIYKMHKTLTLKSRVEWVQYNDGVNDTENGYMVMQDLLYHPLSSPISFAARYALYQTDSYNTRIYAYEHDVLYAYSIPAYAYKGSRFYLKIRYKLMRGIDLWFKYARTFVSDQDRFSNGLEAIQGHHKTEVKGMVRFRF